MSKQRSLVDENSVTDLQVEKGNNMASWLYDASIDKYFGGKVLMPEATTEEECQIIQLYLADKIDSVTGIYLSMLTEQ